MVKKRNANLRRFFGFPIFVGVMRISGILVQFKTLQFKSLCSLLTMRREVSEHIFKNHLVLKKYGYYRCWRSIFFFAFFSLLQQKMHANCNCTLCKGWSPKFATGLNVIIGIDQKNIWVTRLFFCQNDVLLFSGSFWQKDSLVTLILYELCPLWYLAQSQILVTSL